MTRFRFDQFSKQYLEELLTPLGEVTIGKELLGEARQIDVWFVPNPQTPSDHSLGLLERLCHKPCLLEAYRNQPKLSEIRDCLLKLFITHSETLRQSKRDGITLREDQLPFLWILASSASDTLLENFGATEQDWGAGIYFLNDALHTAIIAINQLPQTLDTLWLRLLGKGQTQEQAIAELIALPPTHPWRNQALELLANWRITIELSDFIDPEAQEVVMQLSPVYIQRIEEAVQEGRQEGRQEERRAMLEMLTRSQFGEIDPELELAIAKIIELPVSDFAQLLLRFSGLSREQLLAQLGA